jgi:hypothetical protein
MTVGAAVRIVRTYECPQSHLWSVLTDPVELSAWLGGPCAIEPRVGGTVSLDLDGGTVAATGVVRGFEPPRAGRSVAAIEHTFVDVARPNVTSICRWAVVDRGEACELRITHDGFDESTTDAVTAAWGVVGDGDERTGGDRARTSLDEAVSLLAAARTVLLVSFIGLEVPTALVEAGFDVVAKTGPGDDDWARAELVDGETHFTPSPAPAAADLVHLDWDDFDVYLELGARLGARTIWYHSARTRPPLPHSDRGTWLPGPQSAEQRAKAEAAGLRYVDDRYLADVAREVSRRR